VYDRERRQPQCVFFVEDFDFDWQKLGAEVERHPQFPIVQRQLRARARPAHIDVRFYERGAGFTMSSGTGSTGAFWAAWRAAGGEPVTVRTLAGRSRCARNRRGRAAGAGRLIGGGEFYFQS